MDKSGTGNRGIDEIKNYVSMEVEYAKISLVEKLAEIFSTIAIVAIVLIMCSGVLFYLSFSFVAYMDEILGSEVLAYLVVSGLIALLLLLLIVLRKWLVINPIARFLSRLLLTPDDKGEKL